MGEKSFSERDGRLLFSAADGFEAVAVELQRVTGMDNALLIGALGETIVRIVAGSARSGNIGNGLEAIFQSMRHRIRQLDGGGSVQ